MPLTAEQILTNCRRALTEETPQQANQRIRVILSSEYWVPETLLSSLDLSTFMDDIHYPSTSAFYLRPDCPPDEELAIRLLLQLVRQRTYNFLVEGDLSAIEIRNQEHLNQDRGFRSTHMHRAFNDALGKLLEKLRERNLSEELHNTLKLQAELVTFFENVWSNNTTALWTGIRSLRSQLDAQLDEGMQQYFSDLEEALLKMDNLKQESILAMQRGPVIDNLDFRQHEAASFFASIFASIPALRPLARSLWGDLSNTREFVHHAKFLHALSQNEHAQPNRLHDQLLSRPYHNVVDVANIDRLYHDSARMSPRIIELVTTHHLKGWRAILGDGNCYYRAAMVGVLEQLVLCENLEERQARFSYLAKQLQRLIDDGILKSGDKPAVQTVVRILNDAGAGRALLTLRELEQFLIEHDITLVKATRSALTNAFILNLGMMFNGIDLQTSLEASGYGEPGEYVDNILMRMDACAEGPAVQACLLNTFLGANLHICLLDRETNTVNANPDLIPNVDGYPPINIHLLFRPGHYDLLETVETYNALREAEKSQIILSPRRAQHHTSILPVPKVATRASSVSGGNRTDIGGVELPRPKGVTPPPRLRERELQVQDDLDTAVPISTPISTPISIPERTLESRRNKYKRPSDLSRPPKQTVTQLSSDKKPQNYSFIFSVLTMRNISRVVSILLLLSGLALLGAASFGAVPVAIGVATGVGCFIASLGVFAAGKNQPLEDNRHEAMLKSK